ncbi:MAG: histidine triad nucleotide-binding protein [Candidatus Omnitrophota bacterium]
MHRDGCIFCKIAKGEAHAHIVYEDERAMAFKDLYPQSPTHILIIPRVHYDSLKVTDDERLIGHLFTVARDVAEKQGLTDYRIVTNVGPKAGQSVFHLHIHLLGGRHMGWPPG